MKLSSGRREQGAEQRSQEEGEGAHRRAHRQDGRRREEATRARRARLGKVEEPLLVKKHLSNEHFVDRRI
jgi:hypothetical protein